MWIVVTGLVARSRLDDVRVELGRLRHAISTGDAARVRALSAQIGDQTASAHELTSGPAWWVASNLPGLGTPLRTGRIVAREANRVGRQVAPAAADLDAVLHGVHLGAQDTSGLLGPLRRAGRTLDAVGTTVHRASVTVDAADPSWLPLVSSPYRDVTDELGRLDHELTVARTAVSTAVPMLGSTRPQRYFLGFLNEAEMRGVGGLPGAFAVFTVSNGRLTFTHFGSDDELLGVRASVTMPADFTSLYGQDDPTGDIRNSDVSPDFADAGRIWAGLWQARSGEKVDGALALDPSAVGFVLRAIGPARLPDGSAVTADNVVSLTQERQYYLYGSASVADTRARKAYLLSIAQAVAAHVLGRHDLRAFTGPARLAVAQRRLVLWSADPALERNLTSLGLAGALGAPPGRAFSGFVVNNAAGGKMDLYLDRTISYSRSSCAAGSALATITLHNDTPSYALPPYVTTVLGSTPAGAKPGFTRSVLSYYATPGASIGRVTLDGAPVIVGTASEDGLPIVRLVVDLPANATRTIRVAIAEPATHGPVEILRQPGVRDPQISTAMPSCA